MSQRLINSYLAEIDRLRQFSGTGTEQVIREAFKDLLKNWAKAETLVFIPELLYETNLGTKVYPDGTILHDVRVPLGYWEAKDTADDLDSEIEKKRLKGYPQDNIIYENSDIAVLWQNRVEVMRCNMTDTDKLEKLLTLFFSYQRPEIAEFRRAVEQFKTDLPAVLKALRDKIDDAYAGNAEFKKAAAQFLEHAKNTINPTLGRADVREMLIQHILTEEIFARVFDEADFHQQNNVAGLLYALERAFFTGEVKKSTLRALQPYYTAIHANAAQISSHTEKQTFLKVIYENFYKVYNPDAADRLGVVYTPNEIVRFMIEGTDWLCDKHFGKRLVDEGVEILDPATGTGTYICELIEYFRGQPDKLRRKYTEELHANEVAILPYYVANLNIEATYQAVSGQYAEYPNLCFVDTLDNIGGLGIKAGHQMDLFAAISDENVERVKRQNKRKISVVIGNPPYNANQQNENDNNKNRDYPHIDGLIKRSFVKLSTAQKTKVYDMYARFFRWASDRLHDDGIIAFVTNSSFIDSRTFDGFRKYMAENYNEIYILDLKGNARTSGERRRREGGNIFENQIRVGVTVSFFVKKRGVQGCRIFYEAVRDYAKVDEKRDWLSGTPLHSRKMVELFPTEEGTWINQNENEWDDLLPIANARTKAAKTPRQVQAIFKTYGNGINTARDGWVVDRSVDQLKKKEATFKSKFSKVENDTGDEGLPADIKWSRNLKNKLKSGSSETVGSPVYKYAYRPFSAQNLLYSKLMIDEKGYSVKQEGRVVNRHIVFPNGGGFRCLASSQFVDFHFIGDARVCSFLRFTKEGTEIDNITDWAQNKFTKHYGKKVNITKDDIFAYVYAVLHDPVYRETYAINLKREFPRIPFYPDFHQWRDWGQALLDLHIGYEAVEPWPLTRTDTPDDRAEKAGLSPKPALKADKAEGTIKLDSETTLSGIPEECWDYKLGNRSGLEWILDQYKEKTPRDPTIREKFNTYRFADYKEEVIDLILRVTRVSVETMAITEAMSRARREAGPGDSTEKQEPH